MTVIFQNLLGSGIFSHLARTTSDLTLTAMDLVSQKYLVKEFGDVIFNEAHHEPYEKAIIVINEHGHYLGDWRSSDVETVRQMILLFEICLRWFENHLHARLLSLFAKEDCVIQDLLNFNFMIFNTKLESCDPIQEINETQRIYLNEFFYKILGVKKKLKGTFQDLNEALLLLSVDGMSKFQKEIESLPNADFFDEEGCVRDCRSQIFDYLHKLIKHLDEAIFQVRNYVERLDIALNIKHQVLGIAHTYITLLSDVKDIQQKMQNRDFLTVVIHGPDNSLLPVGIVYAQDLRQGKLGTVSLRDFCNLEEVKKADYLEVISVVDHHKTSLKTLSAPTALISDVQSCNVLIAEQMFILNDKYSLGGMSPEQIQAQIQKVSSNLNTVGEMRVLKRLLQRRLVANQKSSHYIHPRREFIEYLSCLHAILDDTDLLTKVSQRDIECVANLLNRLKSMSIGEEVEIIHFDDLPRGKGFVKAAAQRILQQEDMYALYKQVYDLRESEIERHLNLCSQDGICNIFLDTKEQNGCARVGQTKMFASNFPLFLKHAQKIRQVWLEQSQEIFKKKMEVDLYIHMMSTISSANEVYKNQLGSYEHQDELWLWIPDTQQGYYHLNSFLSGFQYAIRNLQDTLSLEFLNPSSPKLLQIFTDHFPKAPQKISQNLGTTPMVIARF